MSLILQIETATTVCSVALAEDGNVLEYKEINERNKHAEVITIYIAEIMERANKSFNQLDAMAISSGPGSYTGLRIGVSTAKGLCYALNKPLMAIETLEAMASGMAEQLQLKNVTDLLFCPMIDARRMEVYTAVFDAEGKRLRKTEALIIDENSFRDLLENNQILFFGDGAAKCQEILEGNPNAQFITDFTNSAKHLTQKAKLKYLDKNFEDTAYFEPYYLKDFVSGKKS